MSGPADRVLDKLDRLLGKELAPAKGETKPADESAQTKPLVDAMAEVRKLLQRTGAGFAAGAAALLVGLGYAQLHQTFPLPATHRGLVAVVASAGVALAL